MNAVLSPHLADMPQGLAEPVHHAQATFRCVLDALARPGRLQTLPEAVAQGLGHPQGLEPSLAAALLTLLDAETSVWLSPGLNSAMAESWLRFHTGARIAHRAEEADFAAALASEATPELLKALKEGTDEAPHESATLLIQAEGLDANAQGLEESSRALTLTGPGIQDVQGLEVAGISKALWNARQTMQTHFPCGVDIVLCSGPQFAGLPRTTQINIKE